LSKKAVLTSKKLKAISALLQESSITKAAEKAGVSRSTITRWLIQPAFKEELDRQRQELFIEGLNLLKTSAKKAALKLIKFLSSKDPSLVKFATRELLNFAIRAAEIQDIENRIQRLEDKLI